MFASKDIFLKSSGGGYQISRSVRLRSSASAYLNRTPASASNRKTWTWSGWVKRGTLTTDQRLFEGYVDTSNWTTITFEAADRIQVAHRVGGTSTYNLITTAVYRDPSAWYHIVVAFDTTQATSANRVKLYVNGTQITVFTTNTIGAQNVDTFVDATNVLPVSTVHAPVTRPAVPLAPVVSVSEYNVPVRASIYPVPNVRLLVVAILQLPVITPAVPAAPVVSVSV